MNGEVGVSFVGSAKVSGSVAVAAALSEVSGTTESWSLSLANTLRATLSFKVPPQTTSRYALCQPVFHKTEHFLLVNTAGPHLSCNNCSSRLIAVSLQEPECW